MKTTYKVLLTFLLITQASILAFTQVRDRSAASEKGMDQLLIPGQTGKEVKAETVLLIPLEGAIDPSTYIVGPSDVIQVSLWGVITFSFQTVVTPEGTMIIPTVGETTVSAKQLSIVKREVTSLVKKKYPLAEVSVTLLKPRTFYVTLRGAVLRQGQYLATAVDRVEKILREGSSVEPLRPAMNFPPTAAIQSDVLEQESIRLPSVASENTIFERSSMRNIQLVRKNGDTLHVDIPKYYATKDERFNPYLLDGDIIFVPQRDLSKNFISILGAVNAPGRYEYSQGDSLRDMLHLAQGLATGSQLDRIVVIRQDDQGRESERFTITAEEAKALEQSNMHIQRGDRIIYYTKPDGRKDHRVLVLGEVKYPGVHPIQAVGEKLSTVLGQAGGVSPLALLSGAVVLRKVDSFEQIAHPQLEYIRSIRSSNLTSADTSYFMLDTQIGYQPVVVNFQNLLDGTDLQQDVIVHDKDIIYVPSNQHTVLIRGQVANPGYVSYVPGASFDYYIRKVGGYSELAVKGESKVIKRATLEWVDPSETIIEPGDQIWIPKKVIKEPGFYLEVIRDVVGIVGSVGTLILLLIQVSK